jgi:hypothetical protein
MVPQVAKDEPEQVLNVGIVGPPFGQVAKHRERFVREAAVITQLRQEQAGAVVLGAEVEDAEGPAMRRLEIAAPLARPGQLA